MIGPFTAYRATRFSIWRRNRPPDRRSRPFSDHCRQPLPDSGYNSRRQTQAVPSLPCDSLFAVFQTPLQAAHPSVSGIGPLVPCSQGIAPAAVKPSQPRENTPYFYRRTCPAQAMNLLQRLVPMALVTISGIIHAPALVIPIGGRANTDSLKPAFHNAQTEQTPMRVRSVLLSFRYRRLGFCLIVFPENL